MEKDGRYSKSENLEDFYIHLTVYILVNIILFVSNLLLDAGNWWFLYPLCDWGIAVLIQATTLFTSIRPNATLEKKYIKWKTAPYK